MPKKEMLVSLIMPIKNLESYISETLQSIVQQNYQNWELIIINDHSEDGTEAILHQYALQDERITFHSNLGNGIIPALQLGLHLSKGQYISRFDGDDIMPPNRLKLMVEALSTAKPKTIVTGKVKYFSDESISAGYKKYENWLNERIDQNDHWEWAYRECVIASPNWMVRKADLLNMDGFNELSYPEDYDLVLQWYQHGFEVKGIPVTTLHWREHPERTSRNSDHYQQPAFFGLKIKHFVKNDLGNATLIVWGTDKKGRLTKAILDELETPFTWMDLVVPNNTHQIMEQPVLDYRMIEKLQHFKLLITVFPTTHQRQALARYLHELGLYHGRDYHYL